MEKTFDLNFNNKTPFQHFETYDTVYYAGARLDKFELFHKTMNSWPHNFIGDKIGRSYNSQGYRTVKITPGFIIDISEYNMDNEEHRDYYKGFFKRERNIKNQDEFDTFFENYNKKIEKLESSEEFVTKIFGRGFIKYLNKK
jgi:hypothetical protein